MKNARLYQLVHTLMRPVPGYSVAVMRIVMGALLLFESVNYGIFHCLDCSYRNTALLFKYQYFEWVNIPPGSGLTILMFVMGVASIGVMLGFWYRLSIIVVTLCFAWFFLLDAALYLNHYYLTLLFLAILCFIPANRVWALDARRRNYPVTIANWSRLWLIAQLEIVLIYAGVVKLNADWLQLEPLRLWMTSLSANAHPVMQWLTQDPGIALAAYGVIALHIVGAPLLLFKRTRLPVFLVYAIFHSINAIVFNIGIFPFMTLAATTLIFAPDWPLRLWRRLRGSANEQDMAEHTPPTQKTKLNFRYSVIFLFVGLWLLVQVILPTRPLWYPGPVAWNEAGHHFSWRMKLRDKRGKTSFLVRNERLNTLKIVNPEDYLTPFQVLKMQCNPDLIWQFAQFIEAKKIKELSDRSVTRDDISIMASAYCSLNTREAQSLIKSVDLTAIERTLPRHEWVTELNTELPIR